MAKTTLDWLNYYKSIIRQSHQTFRPNGFDIIETALKRLDYLERVNKDLSDSKNKLIEERNNKIIEHRIVYDDYNFQSIKKFVACKGCQYYENEKCNNTTGCFWLTLEKQLKALKIIKEKRVDCLVLVLSQTHIEYNDMCETKKDKLTQEEYDLLKEVLL